jgi:hypothetical protein
VRIYVMQKLSMNNTRARRAVRHLWTMSIKSHETGIKILARAQAINRALFFPHQTVFYAKRGCALILCLKVDISTSEQRAPLFSSCNPHDMYTV